MCDSRLEGSWDFWEFLTAGPVHKNEAGRNFQRSQLPTQLNTKHDCKADFWEILRLVYEDHEHFQLAH